MYKENYGNIPNKDKIRSIMDEAFAANPTKWIIHSHLVGKTCQKIGKELGLDPDIALACGSLFNIGRGLGHDNMAHLLEGYKFLRSESYFFPARLALGYGFVTDKIDSYRGEKNVSDFDLDFIGKFLKKREISPYEKLVIVVDNYIKNEYPSLAEKSDVKEGPRDSEISKIIDNWQKDFEKILSKEIGAYVPKRKSYKFPYNLFKDQK